MTNENYLADPDVDDGPDVDDDDILDDELPPLDDIRPERPERQPAPAGPRYPTPGRGSDDDDDGEKSFDDVLSAPFADDQQPRRSAPLNASVTYECRRLGMQKSDPSVPIWGDKTEDQLKRRLWEKHPEPASWQLKRTKGGGKDKKVFTFDMEIREDPTLQPIQTTMPTPTMPSNGAWTPADMMAFQLQGTQSLMEAIQARPTAPPVAAPAQGLMDRIPEFIALATALSPIATKLMGGGAEVAKAYREGMEFGVQLTKDAEVPSLKSMMYAAAPAAISTFANVSAAASAAQAPPPLPAENPTEAPQLPAAPANRGGPFSLMNLEIARISAGPEHPKQAPGYWANEFLYSGPPKGIAKMKELGAAGMARVFASDLKANGQEPPEGYEAWWDAFFQDFSRLTGTPEPTPDPVPDTDDPEPEGEDG